MLELLELVTLINQCAPSVHPQTMLALVRTESRGDPLALNVNTKGAARPRRPETVEEAVDLVRSLLKKGVNFDAGAAQINSSNFDRLGLTPENVFDPCTNLAAGAEILTGNYAGATAKHTETTLKQDGTILKQADTAPKQAALPSPSEQAALDAALSAYNTGDFQKGIRNGYVAAVRESGKKYAVPALARAAGEETGAAMVVQGAGPVSVQIVDSEAATKPEAPSWDVFARQPDGVMVFDK